jgi:hypothetical protein
MQVRKMGLRLVRPPTARQHGMAMRSATAAFRVLSRRRSQAAWTRPIEAIEKIYFSSIINYHKLLKQKALIHNCKEMTDEQRC